MLDSGVNLPKTYKVIFLALAVFFAPGINKSSAQTLVEDLGSSVELGDSAELFTETIRIIGRSQKIFIITNTNQMLGKGDFITILLNDKDAVARALVGKTHDGLAGIKVLKVYSLKRWAMLRQGLDVQILKGDDSYLFAPKQTTAPVQSDEIQSEEDLYSLESSVEEDISFLEKDSRHIKPDNLVGIAYNQFSFNSELELNDTQRYVSNQVAFNWGYQFSDNYWFEGLYGRTLFNDFPGKGAQTAIDNLTFRLKYTFKAPLYSYIMPYVGYQLYSVTSPDAEKSDDPDRNAREAQAISDLGKDKPIIGVTLLRRLVPGWFLKGDLGNDILSIGVAIEF